VIGGLLEYKVETTFLGRVSGILWVLRGVGIAIDPGPKEDTTKIGEILTCVKQHGIDTEDMKGLVGQHRKQIAEIGRDVEDARTHFDLSKQQLTK
jgi:hypothetical protein